MVRKSVECELKALAWKALGVASESLADDCRVIVEDGDLRVIVQIAPTTATVANPGLWLSETEGRVLAILRHADTPMSGKMIAARLKMRYDTRLKYLLLNMEERELIRHTPNRGYEIGKWMGDVGGMAV